MGLAGTPHQPPLAAGLRRLPGKWSDLITAGDFDEVVAAAMLTLPVNRSLTWTYAVAGTTHADLAEWGDAPSSQLRHVLEPWPP